MEDTKNRWLADAANFDIGSFDINKYIAKTACIADFLQGGRFIVSGPKGYGKTLLLKCIYQTTHGGEGAVRIPQDSPIDTFDYALSFDSKKLDYLSSSQVWDYLWQVGIGSSAILNYAIVTKNVDYLGSFITKLTDRPNKLSSLVNICHEILNYLNAGVGIPRYIKVQANPSSVMGLIMATPLGSIRSSLDWTIECIHQFFLGIDRPVLAFLDQIDQGAKAYPITIWKGAQVGLIAAIFRLHSANRQVKIYGTIRKEAWDSCQDELASQFEDYVCDLSYTENDLRLIFEHAIREFESASTVTVREKYESSPIEAFVGLEKLENKWGCQNEVPFSYLSRHSLRRPRDLILFGKEIHRLAIGGNFSEEKFIELVNRIPGEEIQRQYLNESLPFTESLKHFNLAVLMEKLHKNIYTKQELIEFCSEINPDIVCVSKKGGNCKSCIGGNHLFCDLYRIGLLGVVVRKETKVQPLLQHFEVPGIVRSNHLPESPYYLLHPALDYFTQELLGNFEFSPVRGVVIGNGYEWKEYYDAILLVSRIHNWVQDSAIVRGSAVYDAIDDLYTALLEKNPEVEIVGKIEKLRRSISSEGLLSASQFLANITSTTDMLCKLIIA